MLGTMLWIIAMAGAVGFVLGLFLSRAPALVAGSFLLAMVCAGAALLAKWSFWPSACLTITAMSGLQCSYLAGGLVSLSRSPRQKRSAHPQV